MQTNHPAEELDHHEKELGGQRVVEDACTGPPEHVPSSEAQPHSKARQMVPAGRQPAKALRLR